MTFAEPHANHQAARLNLSTCRTHPSSWFQLAKMRLTMPRLDGDRKVTAMTTRTARSLKESDPAGGFVTGGGWIESPAGALAGDPSLQGRATFGFVSRYSKGATVPSGETEFEFALADLRFRSTSYQWLVVAGAKAQYKGTGTINGTGDYGFLVTATDGAVAGGGGLDKFRMKIVDRSNGRTVYDNVMGAAEALDTAAPQGIGGGSIVIHDK